MELLILAGLGVWLVLALRGLLPLQGRLRRLLRKLQRLCPPEKVEKNGRGKSASVLLFIALRFSSPAPTPFPPPGPE